MLTRVTILGAEIFGFMANRISVELDLMREALNLVWQHRRVAYLRSDDPRRFATFLRKSLFVYFFVDIRAMASNLAPAQGMADFVNSSRFRLISSKDILNIISLPSFKRTQYTVVGGLKHSVFL